jgi:uncharacterized membrane-anchored protein YhcB (DUF1043 family)
MQANGNSKALLAIVALVLTLVIGYAVTQTCDAVACVPRNMQRIEALEKQMDALQTQLDTMQAQLSKLDTNVEWIKDALK